MINVVTLCIADIYGAASLGTKIIVSPNIYETLPVCDDGVVVARPAGSADIAILGIVFAPLLFVTVIKSLSSIPFKNGPIYFILRIKTVRVLRCAISKDRVTAVYTLVEDRVTLFLRPGRAKG